MRIDAPQLILADLEGFFGIVFFLIAFVGWVINLVNQSHDPKGKNQNRRSPQAPGQRKENVQKEIDNFLGQSRRSRPATTTEMTDDVELIAAPPSRRDPPRRRKSREQVWSEQTGRSRHSVPAPEPQPHPQQRPGEALAAHHLQSKTQDSPPRPVSHLAEQVERDLPHQVDEHVNAHLDRFSAASPNATGQLGILVTTDNRESRASLIGALLRSQAGVRNAIILNEILSPPKSLRR